MAGNLPPISSSWHQAPEAYDQSPPPPTEPLLSLSLCKTLSDEWMGLSLTNRLRLCQLYVLRILRILVEMYQVLKIYTPF
jgi:hypothetical protein